MFSETTIINFQLSPEHTPIFTDGSEHSNHSATAVVLKSQTITKRLSNLTTIYTAELYSIIISVNEISNQQHKYYIIFSDSVSSLHTIVTKNYTESPKNVPPLSCYNFDT